MNFKTYFNIKCGCFQEKVFPELLKHRVNVLDNTMHRYPNKISITKTQENCMPLTNINIIIEVRINFKASFNLLIEKMPKKCISKHISHSDTFIKRHKVHAVFKIGYDP